MDSKFQILASTKFIGLADGNIVNWCPTLNLLTVSMNKMSIWVYRLNGERIYSVNNKSPILSISFIDNGKYFCLSGIDNLIKIYDSNSGSLIKVLDKSFNSIKMVKCSCHKSGEGSEGLFKVDILSNLPKLLISSGDQASFTTNSNNDLNLQSLNYLTIVDEIGIFWNFNNLITIPHITYPSDKLHFRDSFDNNNLFQQWFLTEEEGKLELLEIKLAENESTINRQNIIGILTHACKIISIIDYIKDQLSHVQEEMAPFLQLQDRYLTNLHSSITWKDGSDDKKESILCCLYDLLLTGLIPADLKDYFLNQLGERGIKRLNKTGNFVYDSTRKVIFTNIIASLERLLVLLNELKGLSQWFQDSENKFSASLDKSSISASIEVAKSLLQNSYKLIWDVNEEQKLFNKFLTWAKAELVDRITKENDIESYQNSNKLLFKNSDILNYLNEYMLQSKMLKYFKVDLSSCELFEQTSCESDLKATFDNLESECKNNFIDTLKNFINKNVSFGEKVPVSSKEYSKIQCRSLKDEFGVVLILSKIKLSFIKFPYSDPKSKIEMSFTFNNGEEIIDLKFTNDNELLVLLHKDVYYLESIELGSMPTEDCNLNYDELPKIKTTTIEELKEPKYLSVNQSLGCILDSNRQNYIVFKV